MDMSGYTQHDTSQEEADTTVPDTDSESEAEDDDDKTRGRFKTERSDIISLGTSRSRTDIPDTLGWFWPLTLWLIYQTYWLAYLSDRF